MEANALQMAELPEGGRSHAQELWARRRLLGHVANRRDEVVARTTRRLREKLPELFPDAHAEQLVAAAIRAAFDSALTWERRAVERGGDDWVGGPLPEESVWAAIHAARARVPLDTLAHAYRIGHAESWDVLAEAIVNLEAGEELRCTMLRIASQRHLEMAQHLIALATRAYVDETDRLSRDPEQRRRDAVALLLDGDASALPADIDYRLDRWHVAAVVQGPNARTVAQTLGAPWRRELLQLEASPHTAWAWIATPDPPSPERLDALVGDSIPAGHTLAVGEPGPGLAGFRESHAQAHATLRVAHIAGMAAARYRRVAVLAAALADDLARGSFVRLYLGELAGPDERSTVLRETLRTYFASDLNATSAAARLRVRDKTIANRLRAIEELLGPIGAERLELELALRLHGLGVAVER